MNYYYLDGLDKKGPYSADEIINRNLPDDTLVYADNMSNWTVLKNVHDLQQPTKENLIDVSQPISEPIKPNNVQKSKVEIPAILFLFIGFVLAIGVSYLIINMQAKSDYNLLNAQIDDLMSGKDEICDYYNNAVRVRQLKLPEFFIPTDNEGKKVKQTYELISGGFNVLTLTKTLSGFDIIQTLPRNMAFKVAETKWIAGSNYGYGMSTPGFSVPTYRGTVQEAYTSALKYLTSEKENKSYIAGAYPKIKTFGQLSSSFHKVENIEPTKLVSGSLNAKSWSSKNGSVFNSNYIVWYDNFGEHYEIIKDTNYFNKMWLIYSAIGGAISLIVYFILRYRKRVDLKIT